MNFVIDLLIVGAQKAGTSSLLRYLAQHPQICTHWQPEMNYFVDEKEYKKKFSVALSRYFPCNNETTKVLVAKSVGILDSAKYIQRIYDFNPNMQIVISLRNPIDRAYSAYWFARRKGWENIQNFEEALKTGPERFAGQWPREQECSYLERGIYVRPIKTIFSFFPRSQVHIYLLEEMKENLIKVCQELYKLCNLESDFVPEASQRHNLATEARSEYLAYLISNAKPLKNILRHTFPTNVTDSLKHSLQRWNQKQVDLPVMKDETRARLVEFYRPHNSELSQLLQRDLSFWDH